MEHIPNFSTDLYIQASISISSSEITGAQDSNKQSTLPEELEACLQQVLLDRKLQVFHFSLVFVMACCWIALFANRFWLYDPCAYWMVRVNMFRPRPNQNLTLAAARHGATPARRS